MILGSASMGRARGGDLGCADPNHRPVRVLHRDISRLPSEEVRIAWLARLPSVGLRASVCVQIPTGWKGRGATIPGMSWALTVLSRIAGRARLLRTGLVLSALSLAAFGSSSLGRSAAGAHRAAIVVRSAVLGSGVEFVFADSFSRHRAWIAGTSVPRVVSVERLAVAGCVGSLVPCSLLVTAMGTRDRGCPR